uniref:Leucine rich repeat containing 31 n=1 Tax=Astatotilapia calliptera TaxID=8154 RepID=A0A3P8PXQ6_ASTCA
RAQENTVYCGKSVYSDMLSPVGVYRVFQALKADRCFSCRFFSATLLQFLPQVEEMDISWNELIGGSLTALTSHLQHVGEVRTLRLCSCRLNGEDVVALGEALSYIPALEVLDLSWNSGVGGGGLQGLLGNLHPSLRELHLVACQLTAADATVLGSNFKSMEHILSGSLRCLPSVGELDLSCNKLLAGGLSRLTFHLAHVTHLERLDLHLCCLTRDDLEALIQVLPSLTALTELDVSSNKEVGGVVHSLVSALPVTQMRRLPFNSCYLSNESFTALALGVSYLRTVDISWCKVVGGHLALLLDALQPSVVSELRLCSCELTTDDMQHLAAVCRRGCLSSLRALDLSYNSLVGDNGWCSLFAAGGLGSLEDVDVSLRPSTSAPCSAWLPALLRALPQMPALARLAMQRWTADCQEREQLRYCLKKRSFDIHTGYVPFYFGGQLSETFHV